MLLDGKRPRTIMSPVDFRASARLVRNAWYALAIVPVFSDENFGF